MGTKASVVVKCIGTYKLDLPSGITLELNNCYFVPSIIRNIISIPVLDNIMGYSFHIANSNCYILHNDINRGISPIMDRLYLLDCRHNIFHLENKRPKFK